MMRVVSGNAVDDKKVTDLEMDTVTMYVSDEI